MLLNIYEYKQLKYKCKMTITKVELFSVRKTVRALSKKV